MSMVPPGGAAAVLSDGHVATDGALSSDSLTTWFDEFDEDNNEESVKPTIN